MGEEKDNCYINLDKHIKFIKDKNKDLDEMIEKYGRLKTEYDKLVSSEKKLQSENDLLETHLSNSKNEIETLEDKVKKAAIQAKDDKIKLDAALSAKKDNSKEKEKEKNKVNDAEKAINKIADS